VKTNCNLISNFLDVNSVNEKLNFIVNTDKIDVSFIGGNLFPFTKKEVYEMHQVLNLYCNTRIGLRIKIKCYDVEHNVFITNPNLSLCNTIYKEILQERLNIIKNCVNKFNIYNEHILIKNINFQIDPKMKENLFYGGLCTAGKDEFLKACYDVHGPNTPMQYIEETINELFKNVKEKSYNPNILNNLKTYNSQVFIEYKKGNTYLQDFDDLYDNFYTYSLEEYNEILSFNDTYDIFISEKEMYHLDFNN
jgi:hypothetical protein